MSDYPGCGCGHPHAEPSWIDHGRPCAYLDAMTAYWNGEPAEAQRGTGVVVDDGRFPLYWARTEGIVGVRIPVVRVTYGDRVFDIDDRDDIGWLKVTKHHGSPRAFHRSVVIDPDSWMPV